MATAVLRSYSPHFGTKSAEQVTNRSGAMRATLSRTRRHAPHHIAPPAPLLGIEERPEEADRDRLDALVEEAPDRRLGLGLVEWNDDLAEAVDALRDALDEALGHDRFGLPALGEMHDLAHIASADS